MTHTDSERAIAGEQLVVMGSPNLTHSGYAIAEIITLRPSEAFSVLHASHRCKHGVLPTCQRIKEPHILQ